MECVKVGETVDYSDLTRIFGSESFVPERLPSITESVSPFVLSAGYQIAVGAMLLLYVFLIYEYKREMWQTIQMLFARGVGSMSGSTTLFVSMLNWVTLLYFLMAGVLFFKVVEINDLGASLAVWLNGWYSVLLIAAVLFVIFALQVALTLVIRAMLQGSRLVGRLLVLKRLAIAVTAMVIVPLVSLLALNEGLTKTGLFNFIAVLYIFIFILYLYKSFSLFVSQKVSIVIWFLYLCTVEIVPIGTFFALALSYR